MNKEQAKEILHKYNKLNRKGRREIGEWTKELVEMARKVSPSVDFGIIDEWKSKYSKNLKN